jgi:hypothetical protein
MYPCASGDGSLTSIDVSRGGVVNLDSSVVVAGV